LVDEGKKLGRGGGVARAGGSKHLRHDRRVVYTRCRSLQTHQVASKITTLESGRDSLEYARSGGVTIRSGHVA